MYKHIDEHHTYTKKIYTFSLIVFVFSVCAGFCSQYFWHAYRKPFTPHIDPLQQELNIGITYIRYGQQHNLKNDPEKAKNYFYRAHNHFDNALQIKPNCPQGHCYKGITFHQQCKNKEALDELKKAIELNKGYGKAYFNLANILVEEKQFDQAINLYKQILSQEPSNEILQTQLNKAYIARSKYIAQQKPLPKNNKETII
ncbi:tetratricopeptide repeat protein [Candidatus Dependentiae bacterium]|nr:tetratricopeptide repeat protein [Candidatus Dependentiae bacterium]